MRAAFVVFAFLMSFAAAADTVLLKNGRELKGNIRYQDSEVIHLERGGRTEIIRKREIRRMKFEAAAPVPDPRKDQEKRNEENRRIEAMQRELRERERRERAAREKQRIEREKRERELAEARRRQKAEAERAAAEKAEAERAAAEKAEAERAAAEKAEAERAAAEKAEADRAAQKAANDAKEKQEALRMAGDRYFLIRGSMLRGTARGGAAQTALYNMESHSRFTAGLGVRERYKPSSFSSSSESESSGSSSQSSFRRYIDGTDGSSLGSSHSLSPFSAGSHRGGRMEAAFVSGAWRFTMSLEQMSSKDYITLDFGAGVSGPAGASTGSVSMGTATLAEKRTSRLLTAQYSFFRRELVELFVIGGVQSRAHNVWGQSISSGTGSGLGGLSLLAEEKASTNLRGIRFGAGLQIAGTSLGLYSRIEAYSLSGSLSASAIGAGRFLTFTPGAAVALPMVDQTGREGGIAWTTGFFVRFFTRYYFTLEYSLDSSDFRVLETKTFGLDFSSDAQAALTGVLVPQWYTSNPVLPRPPYRAKYRTVAAGLSVRIDWERKN